ncbi:hypothetical protein F442_01463 [Phytophthora nicotianae P10297]|uniref:RxLR effector protein n=1 Tax=Phytophthora nicotianae P10297 TaxID=1317064 RepID=W3A396_PHYNI|nr:hypothetical protein F442_01463 [Phytophthora nicotianae P10297]
MPSTDRFSATIADLVSPVEAKIQHNYDKRWLRGYATENTGADNNSAEATTEERANAVTTLGKGNPEWEAAVMRLAYQHWFDGGKTLDDVRLIMSLPAKGEAVGHTNWGKYLKYVEYVKEKEREAANAAIVAAIKQRLIYKGWYLEGKTFKQVREILELPATGPATNHPNWEKFEGYLAFFKEYSQQF